MYLDYFGGFKKRCSNLSKAHHQYGTNRKVWRNNAVTRREYLLEIFDVFVCKTGSADNSVNVVHRQPRQIYARSGCNCEVDSNVNLGVSESAKF